MPPRKGGFACVPWEGGFACVPWEEAQPPDLRKSNRTSRGAASKEPDEKQRMECGAYMKRLRTVGEEARSLYRVVARLFNQMPQQLVPRDSRSGLPTKSKGWKGLSCCWTREGIPIRLTLVGV